MDGENPFPLSEAALRIAGIEVVPGRDLWSLILAVGGDAEALNWIAAAALKEGK